MLAIASHHPRYTVACGLGVLTSLLLLAGHHGPPTGMRPFGGGFSFERSSDQSLKAKLEESEKDYAINVGRRHAFMRKAGTNPEAIEAYVYVAAATSEFFSPQANFYYWIFRWPALQHEPHMYTLCG